MVLEDDDEEEVIEIHDETECWESSRNSDNDEEADLENDDFRRPGCAERGKW